MTNRVQNYQNKKIEIVEEKKVEKNIEILKRRASGIRTHHRRAEKKYRGKYLIHFASKRETEGEKAFFMEIEINCAHESIRLCSLR